MIDAQTIAAVKAEVESRGAGEETVKELRQNWQGIHFTYCMDDDIGALEPFQEARGFNIYLITGRDHCISFTTAPENATGLVIACLEDEAGEQDNAI